MKNTLEHKNSIAFVVWLNVVVFANLSKLLTFCTEKFWTAPELLRLWLKTAECNGIKQQQQLQSQILHGTQKGLSNDSLLNKMCCSPAFIFSFDRRYI